MKKKLLLIGYRGYGDWVFAAPGLPYLFDKYDVSIVTNNLGKSLFADDPRVYKLYVDDPIDKPAWKQFIEKTKLEVNPDRIIDLDWSIEGVCLAGAHQPEFFISRKERVRKMGISYYDASMKRMGLPPTANLEGLYFTPEDIAFVEAWRKEDHPNDFIVVIPVGGTGSQKIIPVLYELAEKITSKYHNAHIYMVGDKKSKVFQFAGERVHHACGTEKIKTVLLMTKYADYVIGPETGVLCAAGMWGTPRTTLCTGAGVEQVSKYVQNDYSIQSSIGCSPCMKHITSFNCCDNLKDGWPDCVNHFSLERIMKIVEKVYNKKNKL